MSQPARPAHQKIFEDNHNSSDPPRTLFDMVTNQLDKAMNNCLIVEIALTRDQ